MYKQEELKNSPEYYLETLGNVLFNEISDYLIDNKLSLSGLAKNINIPLCVLFNCYNGEIENVKIKDYIKIKLIINGKINL